MAKPIFDTIDAYISAASPDARAALHAVRAAVREAAPAAEEKISYQMPTFTLNGRHLVYFSAWKKHIGFYGVTGEVLDAVKDRVAPYAGEKGSLRFPLDGPMPLALISDIVRRQVAANLGEAK